MPRSSSNQKTDPSTASSEPLVSLLLPVFNAEPYLAQALDSALAQTYPNLEIICLNDGSTDSSSAILKKYQSSDPRVRIIDKQNTGYGDTMNSGIKHSKGKYLYILEPDDWLEKDTIKTLVSLAEKNNLDMIKAEFFAYSSKKGDLRTSEMFKNLPKNTVLAPRDYPVIFYQQPSIWTALYRRSFLQKNKISFLPTPGASYQDAGFNFKTLALASRVMLLSDAFYHYRQDNPNSSVKSSNKLYSVKEEYDSVSLFLKERNLDKKLAPILAVVRCSSYIWNQNRLSFSSAKEFARTIKQDCPKTALASVRATLKTDKHARYCLNHPAISSPYFYPYFRPIYLAYESIKIKLYNLIKK